MAPETPKGVSSRLLSMKFMQRAAASSTSTPGSDTDAPSSKKRKLGNKSDEYDLNISSESIQAAIDERDAKRQAALRQHSSVDTHWVLNTNVDKEKAKTRPLRVVYVGYGDIDSDDNAVPRSQSGRTSTKKHKKAEESKAEAESESQEDDEDDEDDDHSDPDGKKRKRDQESATPSSRSRSLSRTNSKLTPEADRAKSFRDKRKKRDVNINRITSISNPGLSPSNTSTMVCFTCQQKGHKAADCPQKGKKSKQKS